VPPPDPRMPFNSNQPGGPEVGREDSKVTTSRLCSVSLMSLPALSLCLTLEPSLAHAQGRPSMIVIWGDDIGWENASAYGIGVMGYTAPNIDSIGAEGIRFTGHHVQPSCNAGRAPLLRDEPERHDRRSAIRPHG
jgi:hypothetical protein